MNHEALSPFEKKEGVKKFHLGGIDSFSKGQIVAHFQTF
jgi:hypothetical protein